MYQFPAFWSCICHILQLIILLLFMQHATHTVVFSQLLIDGRNEGVHAFVCQIRDENGRECPGIRVADCGHKIGLNGVDNGRIWYAQC